MNKDQVTAAIMSVLGLSGPVAKMLSILFKMDDATIAQVLGALSVLTPMLVGAWFTWKQRDAGKVAGVASMSAPDQAAALNKVPDSAKVLIAESTPGVATVVVKDGAGNGLGKLAADETHPNIVTETQNEHDAKSGTKP